MISLVFLVSVLLVAVGVAANRHRGTGAVIGQRRERSAFGAPDGRVGRKSALEDKVDEWLQAGIIDAEEAAAIVRYEAMNAPVASRIPMAAEAVGYVGSALVIAAIALLIGRRWDDLAVGLRIAVFAVPALIAAGVGWRVGAMVDPAFERMGSVLWVLSTAAFAGSMVVVFVDAMYGGDPPEHGGLLFVGGIVAVWAGAAYGMRRLALQQLVLYASSMVTVLGVVNALEASRDNGYSRIVWGLAIWSVGAIWTAIGIDGRLAPSGVARLVGPATVLFGAQMIRADAEVLGLWLGLASAAVIIAIGVWRSDALVLLVGTAGLFQWAPQLAVFYLADAIGTEATLLVVGVLLLGVASVFTRLFRRVRSEANPADVGPNRLSMEGP